MEEAGKKLEKAQQSGDQAAGIIAPESGRPYTYLIFVAESNIT